MTREQEYELTLKHVAHWLSGQDGLDALKPLSAQTANRIAVIVTRVLAGETLQNAIEATA